MAKRKQKPQPNIAGLDIVIPVYGRPDLLAKCLDSIEAARDGLRLNIVIIDDAGPDQPELNRLYGSLNGHHRLIRHSQNAGFPRTVNDGIKAGVAPFVLILNTDVELTPGSLQAMLAEFSDPKIGVVGPLLLFPHNSSDPRRPADRVQHAGLGVNFRGEIVHLNIGWSADHPKVQQRREVQAVTGACLMVRREVLNRALKTYNDAGDPTKGPFNEVYSPGTYEDAELCFVARSLDYKVIYTPAAVAYHHVGASVEQSPRGYPINRNAMIFNARCGALLIWDEWRYL
jgi:GT2 family glycosyltransferase